MVRPMKIGSALHMMAVMLFLFVTCLTLFSCHQTSVERVVSYQDDISDLVIYDLHGDEQQLDTESSKLIIYASNTCGQCLDEIGVMYEIYEIFCRDTGVNLYVLWAEDIPRKYIKEYDFADCHFSLNGVKLSSSVKASFYVDEQNVVQFVDSAGMVDLLKYVVSEQKIDPELLKLNANAYIMSNIFTSKSYPQIVYLSMRGCPDCDAAAPIVYSDRITSKADITQIEREGYAEEDDVVDVYKIFQYVYEIDWYPSFLILKPDGYDIIGKTDIEMLEETILDALQE